MPEGSSSQAVDGNSLASRKHIYLADSILCRTPKNDIDGGPSTSQHVEQDVVDVFQPSPMNRRFCLDSPQQQTSPSSWQDDSTEPLLSSNRPSPSTQYTLRHSPYASPLQRLEQARQARNKDPYHSPSRTTTHKRKALTSAPQPLDFSNVLRTPDTQSLSKKQKTMDLLDHTGNFSWTDAPSPLVLDSSQKHHPNYYPPTPLTQPTLEKPSAKLDLFECKGPPPDLNLPESSLETKDTLQQKDIDRKQKIQLEMETLTKSVKTLRTHYKLVDKIGCGTFSSVFKAQDLRYGYYDNSSWEMALACASSDPASPKYVALKQIHATSSPKRMAHEINILKDLRGAPCVSQLITAFREHENVFLVMPYFRHNDFRDCFRKMDLLDIKYYFRSLFTALKHLHSHGILHRDVKPNNFLYNMNIRSGILIDFGLAQREDETRPPEPPKSSLSTSKSGTIRKPVKSTLWERTNSMDLFERSSASSTKLIKPVIPKSIHKLEESRKPGYIKYDTRKSIKASRAGTRGFRAPEVLLRVTHQTIAIDIWSTGVILLSLLTGRYPFFIAHDEGDSLIEIANLFGLAEMKKCAALHNRTFETNIKTIPPLRKSLTKLCKVLNTEKFKWWMEEDQEQVSHAIDLLEKLLVLDHRQRITAQQALSHPFLSLSL